MFEAIRSEVFIEMDDRLGIALRAESMPSPFEPMPQFAVVVDFPVENQSHRCVFIGHRLSTCIEVDDRESPEAQRDPIAPSRFD